MTAGERDLVAALRAELASIDPSRPCDRDAERAGIEDAPFPRDPVLARLAVRLGIGRDRGHAGETRPHDQTPPPDETPRDQTRTADPATPQDPTGFDWDARPDHCRMAWLRGRFLARGSLSIAGGRTHLEFVVTPEEAPVLAARLADVALPASWRLRRGRGVVTWKSAELVGTFLRRIGAGASLLELEARQVSRTLRGELNRVLNAESANLQRSVAAAGRQLAAIDVLESDGRLAAQPYVVRVVAEARRETPEATITELAERLGIHRSAVQRALDRLERLVLHGEAPAVPLS